MADLEDLFNAFYNGMILRDFFGKVVPGLILLSAVAVCVWWEESSLSDLTKILGSVSLSGWLAVFGAAWITGFGLRCFGESFPPCCREKRLHRYFPAEIPNHKAFFEFRENFRDNASPEALIDAERLVVIKEACGNAYVSLAVSLLFVILYIGLSYRVIVLKWRITIPVLLLWVFLIYYLRKMHLDHVERQLDYMKAILDHPKKAISKPTT
jgi:hypothetical protein